MSPAVQSYANHRRFVPGFHFFVLPLLAVNAVGKGMELRNALDVDHVIALLVAIAILLGVVFGRVFALRAQDRVIRLEMRARLATVLPADLRARIDQLTPSQLIAIRFASDGELPGLVATVLKDDMRDKNAIKKLIRQWQADNLRV